MTLSERAAEHAMKLQQTLGGVDWSAVERAADSLYDCRARGGSTLVAGNGASAALASQLALDLGWGRRGALRRKFAVVSLVDNVPLASAIANDVGFDRLFSEQTDALMRPGDVLIAISGSGNSENVLRAQDVAARRGCDTIGVTGFDGGKLHAACTHPVHAPTEPHAYAIVEAAHHVILDVLASHLVDRARLEEGRP